jgi:hypothetical protein
MKPKCPQCNKELHDVAATNPWSNQHYICIWCDGTYNLFEFCVFCGLRTETRSHHIIPKSRGGTATVYTCLTCESFIHNTWSHRELEETYNNVETIVNDPKFQKFLKWRLKQPVDSEFKSSKGQFRDKRKYS